jgi:HEPN domain-containing protein
MRGAETNPEDWFAIARRDLERAEARLSDGDLEDCTFRRQQAAEKAMKGALILRGWNLARAHMCTALIDVLAQFGMDVEWFRPATETLQPEYFATRYPGDWDAPPDASEVQRLVLETRKLFDQWVSPAAPAAPPGP